jgi:hypothetical protein
MATPVESNQPTTTGAHLEHSSQTSPDKEASAGTLMSSLKRNANGHGFSGLGSDGVLRSFDGPFKHTVIDAVGLSPQQIKELLDKQEWSQSVEDKFRGVDGRMVSREQMFSPLPQDCFPDDTEESIAEKKMKIAELNRKLDEQIEKDRLAGVDVDSKYACARVRSDYNLDATEE